VGHVWNYYVITRFFVIGNSVKTKKYIVMEIGFQT